MKWIILLTLAAAVLTALVAASPASAATEKRCTQVVFTPESEDVATKIRARGVTCGMARDFIRDSKGKPGTRYRGFACTSTLVESAELPYTRYRCTADGDRIRWRRY
jgi:hypothetical protein